MPIAEQVRVSTHTGNGVTVAFAYGFKVFADADLEVRVDDVLQTLTTHYTVTGAGDAGGGTVVFVTIPINLAVVTISGELAYERETDFIENGAIRSQTLDDDLDKATMLIQQLRRDVRRSIKVPIEETDDQVVPSTAAERANKVLGFGASGEPVAQTITDLSSVLSSIAADLTLASGVLSITHPNRFGVAGGSVNAITTTTVPVVAALTNNLTVIVESQGTNTVGNPTFAPDGMDAKVIVKDSDVLLEVADIGGAGYRMHLVFDASLDKWVLLNPAVGLDNYIVDTGAADVYVMTLVPSIVAYVVGQQFFTKITNANLTTTPTLNVNGLGAKTIKRAVGAALLAGDLPVNHHAVFRYDGTDMILMNPYKSNLQPIVSPTISGDATTLDASAWPSFSAHRNTVQQDNITGTDKVEFTTEEFDTNSDFDAVTNFRFTPTVAGKYLLTVTLGWLNVVATDNITILLYKNGAEYLRSNKNAGTDTESQTITAVVTANGSSDYFEVFAINDSRDTSDLDGATALTRFSGCRIG